MGEFKLGLAYLSAPLNGGESPPGDFITHGKFKLDPTNMKLEQIKVIHATATAFATACAAVIAAQKDGSVEVSRASANDKALKVSSVHVSDTTKLAPDALATLKRAVKLHNAGHAFQAAYGVKLAQLADVCTFAAAGIKDESKVEPIVAESAPVATKTKKAA